MIVIGNGESRKLIDIDKIKSEKIGCNAIHRDYYVDHLICVDRRMVNEAIQNKRNKSLVYTRKDWWVNYRLEERIKPVPDLPYSGDQRPDQPWHWGSGPYAVLLATKFTDKIKLLGFDLYGIDNKVNNVYKNTENYDNANKRAVDPRYWIYQIGKVFEHFPKKEFIIFQTNEWELPKSWNQSNVKVDMISNIV